ncbi:cation:proton antiporter [Aspergillus lucknowensis]|uniref:Sodium/hydrogen exchanger family-domain-containing protein n=1 Tax=Aspergillus lucknowensis TaxID=176173 RepID=A0ABR4LKH9_9EURO
MAESAFAYHEPSISTILNQTGLLLVLNLVNTCLDKLLYCGLIGQLFIGILWGTPGAKWLDRDMETVVQQLGYLGLIMLVYEGGLSTSVASLRVNMYLSLAVAFTGIGVPIALSFILMELVSATPLQAFAAGASLSATSLGTTFTILSSTELISTRLGTVTTSAAMLDDVVGLVMVQIISNLGRGEDSFSAGTVIRPLFVSLGFGVGVVVVCRFVARPILLRILESKGRLPQFARTPQFAFLGYTGLLVGLVAGATYAGTSSLFAAYLAGVISSWFDSLVHSTPRSNNAPSQPDPDRSLAQGIESEQTANPDSAARGSSQSSQTHEAITGTFIYEHYYHGPVNRILIPMFFASIGFAIPITEMFEGSIVWRGFVYAILMAFAKMCTGLWLVRFSPLSSLTTFVRVLGARLSYATSCIWRRPSRSVSEKARKSAQESGPAREDHTTAEARHSESPESGNRVGTDTPSKSATPIQRHERPVSVSLPPKPKSLYPASILSLAMVARGEIGYLIASLAESNGIFGETSEGSSETYLIVVCAISLCTLVGPISVGTLVKRVKSLQLKRANTGGPDPLVVWGI